MLLLIASDWVCSISVFFLQFFAIKRIMLQFSQWLVLRFAQYPLNLIEYSHNQFPLLIHSIRPALLIFALDLCLSLNTCLLLFSKHRPIGLLGSVRLIWIILFGFGFLPGILCIQAENCLERQIERQELETNRLNRRILFSECLLVLRDSLNKDIKREGQ